MVNRRRYHLGLLAALTLGIAVRGAPLYRSPLPFNPDGIVYAGLAAHTLDTGTLPLALMAVDSLAFTVFHTILAVVTGATPLSIAQPAIAVVGTVPVLLAAMVTVRLAGHRGWTPDHGRTAGVLAALLLAVEGLYLHRSMPVDEQTIGLLLVPLAIYAVVRTRSDRRYWIITLPVLGVLPVLHNLDAVVAGLALLLVAALAVPRDAIRDVVTATATALGFGGYAIGVTVGAAMVTPAVIVQQSRLTEVPGLLLAWILLLALGVLWLRQSRPRSQRLLVATVFLGGFAVLAANAVRPVFPGLPATDPRLLAALAPLVVLPLLAVVVLPWVSEDPREGRVILGLVGAVLVLVGVSLTAALTAPYLNTVYRAQTFVHLPIVVLAALGTTVILTHVRVHHHPWRQGAVVAVILLAVTASIPVAFAGLELLPYKGTTTPAELAASGFTTHHVEGVWASDDHLSRITTYYRPDPRFRTNPPAAVAVVAAWLTGGDPPTCPTLVQDSWTTTGAQLYPRDPATITADNLNQWMTSNHVVYTTASTDPIRLVLPTTATVVGCSA